MAEDREPKIGAGHLSAMGRAGLKEISQALQAFPDSIRTVEEPGLFANLTPQEIVHGKQDLDKMLDGYASRGVPDQGRDQDRGLER